MKAQLAMDMMARMADDWGDTAQAMLSVTIALVMRKLEVTSVTVALDEVRETMDRFAIIRTYSEVDGRPYMTVTVEKKRDTDLPTS